MDIGFDELVKKHRDTERREIGEFARSGEESRKPELLWSKKSRHCFINSSTRWNGLIIFYYSRYNQMGWWKSTYG
jgi:hypothetical protein